ncbi:MAG: ABC transporter substrate-binding protein, partial [Bacillaceae bacterium]
LVPKGFVKDPSGVDFRDANKDLVAGTKDDAKKYWEQGLKEIGKDKVTLELLNSDSEVAKKIGEYIKEQLQNNLPGLTVNIKQQPFKQKLDLETKLDYDFSMGGWGPDYPDPMTFLDMFVTDGGHNQMAYSNPEFDKLISDAKTTLVPDQQKRWEALLQAEKILIEKDQAISPIYQRGATYLQKPYVKNVVDYSFGPDWLFKSVYIEK